MSEENREYEDGQTARMQIAPGDRPLRRDEMTPFEVVTWDVPIDQTAHTFCSGDNAYFQPGFPYVLAFMKDGEFAKNKLWRIMSMSTGITSNDPNILSHLTDCRSKEASEESEIFMTMMICDRVLEDNDGRIRFHIWVDNEMHCIFFAARDIHHMYQEISKSISGSVTPDFASNCFWITRLDQLKNFSIGCLYEMSKASEKNLHTMVTCKACTGIYEKENFERALVPRQETFAIGEFSFGLAYNLIVDWQRNIDRAEMTLLERRLEAGLNAIFIGFSGDRRVAKFLAVIRENYEDWEKTTRVCVMDLTIDTIRYFGFLIKRLSEVNNE